MRSISNKGLSGVIATCAALLLPLVSYGCPFGDVDRCKERLQSLIIYRAKAMESEFGDVFGEIPQDIKIEFVSSREADSAAYQTTQGYDAQRHTFILPLRLLAAKTPNPLAWAVYYWPFYQSRERREAYPVIETVDNLLWTAYLKEAAGRRGLKWPHEGCDSDDLAASLPCEMLMEGIEDYVKQPHEEIFNENRLDLMWPEDFAGFRKGLWHRTDSKYRNVKHFGGILLVKPLIEEFGLARALTYMAQTPFRIEDNNLRLSAQRYQERARKEIM
jgi:hypothetical protein